MRVITTITLITLGLLCNWSCEDDSGFGLATTTNAKLQVVAEYDGSPLILGEVYNYENGYKVSFSEFSFFVSYLSLVQENDNNTLFSEVELIDFTEINQNVVTALEGVQLDFHNIPIGHYTGLKIGIGVVADLNRTTPDEYGESHPLNNMDNYRPQDESFIFTKIKGAADLNGDSDFNHTLIYETISDDVYRDVVIEQNIQLTENTLEDIRVTVDLKKLLVRSPIDYIDIQTNHLIFDDPIIMKYIADNFQNAIQIE